MPYEVTNPQLFIDVVVAQLRQDFFEPRGYELPKNLPVRFGNFSDFAEELDGYDDPAADAVTASDVLTGHIKIVVLTPRQLDPKHGIGTDAGGGDSEGYYLAATTAHELMHAALAGRAWMFAGHGGGHQDPMFIEGVYEMGLGGAPCCTYAGLGFREWLDRRVRPEYDRLLKERSQENDRA